MSKFLSPAKVNLTFRVLGKRPDGYHDIETLMQAVSLGDWVSLSISDQDQITCTREIEDNLAWRAVEAYRRVFGKTDPIAIHIEKHIPIQAGLGGGSSNAATVLYALNRLYGRASEEELRAIGKMLGNDVPFFFSSGTALYGNGVILEEKELPERMPQWIAVPKEVAICTTQAYAHCCVGESLEPAAIRVKPEMAEIKKKLNSCFQQVFMTGSGSGFVCYGTNAPKLEEIDFYPIQPLRKKGNSWYDRG